MVEVRQTGIFTKWLRELSDRQAKGRVLARIDRLRLGNPGDVKPVGQGVSELRIHYGPGYRVYFVKHDTIILLVGGTKDTQARDIDKALTLAKGD